MERALQKLARQLNQYDDASLSDLWERYAQTTARFEPTRRWEEAALIFCMIQAVHWKNQLFNAGILDSQNRALEDPGGGVLRETLRALAAKGQKAEAPAPPPQQKSASGRRQQQQRRKILPFPSGDQGQA